MYVASNALNVINISIPGMNITFQNGQLNVRSAYVDLTSHLSTSQSSKTSIMLLEEFLLLGDKQARRD